VNRDDTEIVAIMARARLTLSSCVCVATKRRQAKKAKNIQRITAATDAITPARATIGLLIGRPPMPIQTGKGTTCALLGIRIDKILSLNSRYSYFTEPLFTFRISDQ
jgi:hypothetical protein